MWKFLYMTAVMLFWVPAMAVASYHDDLLSWLALIVYGIFGYLMIPTFAPWFVGKHNARKKRA